LDAKHGSCCFLIIFAQIVTAASQYVKLYLIAMKLFVSIVAQAEKPKSRAVLLLLLLAVACVVTSGIAVMICSFVIRHRCSRHKLPLRDRIVSMHSNALYLQNNAAAFDKDLKSNPIYNVSHGSTTAPLLAQLVPRISGRMCHGLASLSDYEIPLDKHWELPREWYVHGASVYAL